MNYSLSEMILIVIFTVIGAITLLASFFIIFHTIKNWKKNSLKRSLLGFYSALLMFGIAWLFAGIFFIEDILLGGTYLNGKIEDNQYYLGRGHGYYTKVSKKNFKKVEILDKIFVVYFILCLISIPIVQFTVKDANKTMLEEDK